MNTTTLVIGVAILLFGVYTTVMRFLQPQKMAKLEALKDLFGDKTGNLIHLGAYSVIPLLAGVIFVIAGVKGISLL